MIPFFLMAIGLIDAYGSSIGKLFYIISYVWILYVVYHALIAYHRITKDYAIISVIAMIFIFMIVSSFLGKILIGTGYRFM